MDRFRSRFRFWLVLILFGGGLFYISYRFNHFASGSWIQRKSVALLSPIIRHATQGQKWLSRRYQVVEEAFSAQKENERLKSELALLKSQSLQLEEAQKQSERWQAHDLPQFKDGIRASVIGYDARHELKSLLIDVGTRQGVHVDQAVVANGGLVGRVLKVYDNTAQVLMINDVRSTVDVLDAKTRAQGTLVGVRKHLNLNRDFWLTQAEYISVQEEIHEGDLLLTSGMDGIFPKGIMAGVVSKISKDASGIFWHAEVNPFVELQKVEEVLVLPKENL